MAGYIYVLRNDGSKVGCKVGRTIHPPEVRAQAVRNSIPYAQFSKRWDVYAQWAVEDPVLAERIAHSALIAYRAEVIGTREIFRLHPVVARSLVERALVEAAFIEDQSATMEAKISALPEGALEVLGRILVITGLAGRRDMEGRVWTVSLMPSTGGGRWWTLNIGMTEVFFVSRAAYEDNSYVFSIVGDPRIFETISASEVGDLPHRYERLPEGYYRTATGVHGFARALSSFPQFLTFLDQRDFRRGLVAYWQDHLISNEKVQGGPFARFHRPDLVTAALSRAVY